MLGSMKTLSFQVSDDLFIQLRRAVSALQDGNTDRVPLRALCAGMLADTLAHRTVDQLRALAAGQSLPLGRPPVPETASAPTGKMTDAEQRAMGDYMRSKGLASLTVSKWRGMVARGEVSIAKVKKPPQK